jgi:hypothetical protein
MRRRTKAFAQLAPAASGAVLLLLAGACQRSEPGTFATPEEAVQALDDITAGDDRALEAMFGPGSVDLFRSGDEAEDQVAAERVKEMIAEKVAFEEMDADTRVALFGAEAWPFPIPLVRTGERWRFDTAAGREELLNRRIGFNELATLESLHAYVDAQKEYAAAGRDGNPPAFAQRFISTEGKHDGLYWAAEEGEEPSPIGDLLAEAAADYEGEPQPFRGYRFKILTRQGPSAPGGNRDYLDDAGRMTGGFAAIAWPAKYDNSGIMTFLVNHRDIVFQRDLGPETERAVAAIDSFDPDASWEPTGDSLGLIEDDGEEAPAE